MVKFGFMSIDNYLGVCLDDYSLTTGYVRGDYRAIVLILSRNNYVLELF
jgi:hypothetical protein